jgi:ribokinase
MTQKTPDLLIIGQATIDDIFEEDQGAISLETPGGDSIYATIGATAWPIDVAVVTCVGADYPKEKLMHATCNSARTDWGALSVYDGPSIRDKALYHKDGSRTYTFDDPTLLDTLSPGPEDVPPSMSRARHVHLAPENIYQQLELVRFFRKRSAVVTLDVETHFFENHKSVLEEMLAHDPIFVPSLEHVQQLSGIMSASPSEIWPWVRHCGVRLAVVKCGARGAWVFDVPRKEVWKVGVVPDLDIVDVTGAGDSFCGGYVAGLILGRDPVKAAAYGAVSASFVVESLGAQCPRHYSIEEARHRLEVVLAELPHAPVKLG